MKMLFHYQSVRLKFLAAVATTSIATLLVTLTLIGIYDWNDYKTRWLNDLSTQAILMGLATAPALEFDDQKFATNYLKLLEVRPRIHSAALYNSDGRLYASFRGVAYESQLSAKLKTDRIDISGDEVLVVREIVQHDNLIGYILLKAEYGLYKRLISYFSFMLLIGILALLVSQLIARWLQQQITQPIEGIAELAKKVVNERDFSLRAKKTTADEVGDLVDAFNTMLGEIERGNKAQEKSLADLARENEVRKEAESLLQKAHDDLETRVQERTEELQKAQSALLQSQKLDAIGKLTGGVAHDFNNILQVIGSNLDILLIKYAGLTTAQDRIESALAAVQKGAKLASQLLAFARKQPLQPVPTNLNNLMKNMDDLLRRALGENIEIELIQGGGLWNVLVDRNQIENVIINLCINARDAMDNGGQLTIETGNAMLDDLYAENNLEIEPGQYVMLAISDTGCGMPPDVLEKAIEPFFTTKQEGKGTGLGLSMAYGLIKQSSGHMNIYSEVGHGTTIKIYLPRIQAEEVEHSTKTLEDIQTGNESILVVEDDFAVQKSVSDILTGLGYRVQTASDAQSALAIIESGKKFDMLFTDVVMPGPLKSSELAKIAKAKLPDIAILFTSGYTQNAIVHGGKLDAGVELINKPYRYLDLARKIRTVMDKTKKENKATENELNAKAKEAELTQNKVLVVEDNSDALITMCDMLSILGYEATGVSSALDALGMLENFDILLTDVNLPGMSGIELAKKTNALYPAMPIIISSGMDISTELGFEPQILPKPFSLALLTEILMKVKAK